MSSRPQPRGGGASRGEPASRAARNPASSPARGLAAQRTEDTPRPVPGRPMDARAAHWVSRLLQGNLEQEKSLYRGWKGESGARNPAAKKKKMKDPRSEPQAEWTSNSPRGVGSSLRGNRQPR